VDVRRLWPDVVEAIRTRRRLAWMLLTQNAQVTGVDEKTLTVGFNNPGARESFVKGGNDEVLRQAAIDVVGVDWRIEAVVDPGAGATGMPAASHTVTRPSTQQQRPAEPAPQQAQQAQQPQSAPEPPRGAPEPPPADQWAPPEPPSYDGPGDPYDTPPPPDPQESGSSAVARARGQIQQTRSGGLPPVADDTRALADAAVSPDDPDVDTGGADQTELLKRTLGAQVIEEIKNS